MSSANKHRDATALAGSVNRQAGRLVADEAAGAMIVFALTLPVLMAATGMAVDYSLAASTRSKMQAAADAAALASVRELQLARPDSDRIAAIANNVVNNSLQNVTTAVNVDRQAMTVRVAIEKQYTPVIHMLAGTQLHASATAKMSGSMPLCLLGLDLSAPQTIGLEHSALLTAPDCLVQSNSKSPSGIQSKNDAVMRAGMICSAGGKVQSITPIFLPPPPPIVRSCRTP
jgi:Flp pilus assembly protein TadG